MKSKKETSIEEWKMKFLHAYKLGDGALPKGYPYSHWASWLREDKACPNMYEGWLRASKEYEGMINES
jgi:hypothetical protein